MLQCHDMTNNVEFQQSPFVVNQIKVIDVVELKYLYHLSFPDTLPTGITYS